MGTEFDPVPIGDASTTYDSGISWFNNGTGASDKSYRIYDGSAVTSDPSLGKNAGLGDLEVLCNAAPIEFGNRVWDDQNGNGIQDPGEAGISGVTVRLYTPGGPDGSIGTVGDNATAIAVTVTNANGEYYFRVVDADNNGYPDGQPGLV